MKRIYLAASALLLLVFVAIYLPRAKAPNFPVQPVSLAPRQLTLDEVRQTIHSDLKIFRTVGQVPQVVQNDYKALTGDEFRMVNPGHPMSTDVIIPGVPNKRLVLLALGQDREVLLFERGGFANSFSAMIVLHGAHEGAWYAYLEDYPVKDLADIERAINSGKFEMWANPA